MQDTLRYDYLLLPDSVMNRDSLDLASLRSRLFGRRAAKRYDAEAVLMASRYHEAHRIQNQLVIDRLQLASRPAVLIDVGCGTATDGVAVLGEVPHARYVGIDSSRSMLQHAKSKLRTSACADRSALVRHDVSRLGVSALRRLLQDEAGAERATSIISAFVLHHYSRRECSRLYRVARECLVPKGLLVLTDLYTHTITRCASLALATELADIRVAECCLNRATRLRRTTTISEMHYRFENRPRQATREIACLRSAGFRCVDVAYRAGQVAVLVAERG